MNSEKLAKIYAKLSEEVDELHDKYEDLKVDPNANFLERRRLLNFRCAAGPRDHNVSPLYTVPYLLHVIDKKREERRDLYNKIIWLNNQAAHDMVLKELIAEEAQAQLVSEAQTRGDY